MSGYCKKSGSDCFGDREFKMLFEVSTLLNRVRRDLKDNLEPVIKILADHLNAEKVILAILNRANGEISIQLSHGLSEEEQRRGIYKIGEGIIGSVVQTGKPIVLTKVAESKEYLNRTKIDVQTQDLSFICVPIKEENEVVGTLSIHRVYNQHITVSDDSRVLSIVGSLIAQAVRTKQEYTEEIAQLQAENQKLHHELREHVRPSNIIGNSGTMQGVYELIDRVAPTTATVLIRGESGVGKELIAEALHHASLRKDQPFIKVNCAALPDSLIESELFGHERGAFTGANVMRKGRFEAAEGGTIFLDEIGDLPSSTQVKLLRVLQQREFERVGSTKSIKVDVRIICATNRNLEEQVERNEFREDLFYRINVFPLFIPPLRERITDIPGLVDHFIAKCNKTHGTKIKRVSSSTIDILMVYHWPGNIRELQNCIERACILSTDNVIRPNNLPPTLQTANSSKTKSSGTLESVLEKVEQQMLHDTLIDTKGNLVKAAEILGITERMIGIRIKKYGIDPKKYKKAEKQTV